MHTSEQLRKNLSQITSNMKLVFVLTTELFDLKIKRKRKRHSEREKTRWKNEMREEGKNKGVIFLKIFT